MNVTGQLSQAFSSIGLVRNVVGPAYLPRFACVNSRLCCQRHSRLHTGCGNRRPAAAIGAGTLSKTVQTSSDAVHDAPWLIVGLGNIGARYSGTRHNVGFQVLDALARKLGVSLNKAQDKAFQARGTIAGQQVILAKPITFMNLSGEAVGKLTRYYKVPPQQVLVVHDDLDLPTGKVRLRAKGGHGGHNGMRSIVQHLKGSQDFPRLKIGIGRPSGQLPVASFVLQAFDKTDAVEIDIAVQECCDIIQAIMTVGLEKALSGVRA
ncbi:hypothetical protein ABBQ32_005560 [Trebouxia sp. C0010 RCD-2024]